MIRIKDYILNEDDISYIVGNTDDDTELKIQWKGDTSTYIKASFEDIEWNYGQSNIKEDEYIELSNKYQRLCNRNEELEEKNRIFEDCNFDLNRQIEKVEEENKKLKEEHKELVETNYDLAIKKTKLEEENKKLKYEKENAIEYMEHYIEMEDAPINERIKIEFKEVLNKLKGEEND